MTSAITSPSARALALSKQISQLDSVLSANSEDWKPRAKALVDLEELVTDGLRVDGYEAFTEIATPLLTSLATSLTTQITDLRSEIVRQCAHTLSFLALHVPVAFTKAATKLFPSLLKVASGTNGVIRSYAAPACEEVVQHVPHHSLLLDLLNELKTSKNKVAIALCSHLLLLVLRQWNTKVIRKSAQLVEETVITLLAAADASTRTTAGQCALLYLDHFPARSRLFLQLLDPRATKIVNECRQGHIPAANVSVGGGKLRSDSVTSVESFVAEEEEEKRPSSAAVTARPSARAVGGGDKHNFTYGQKVEIVDVLTSRGDVDDSTQGVQIQGRKGTVISCSQREGRTGEWVGVRLEAEVDAADEERRGAQVVYVRPSTLRKEGWRVTRLRAPPIDTSHSLKTPPSSQSSSSPYTSTSLPPSPAPSSASSYVTPSSARSRMTPSPVQPRKSTPPQSVSPQSTPRAGSASTTSRPSTGTVAAAGTKLTPPSITTRASTSPVTRIPGPSGTSSGIPSGASSRPTSVLPSSRIPLPPSRLQSRAQSRTQSRIQSRTHSRASSGHFMAGSPSISQSSSPMLHASSSQHATSSVPALSTSPPTPTQSPLSELDFPSLLAMHRAYDTDVTSYQALLSSTLRDYESRPSDPSSERVYSETMIRLLSDHLKSTTRLLEAHVGLKRKGLQQQSVKLQQQQVEQQNEHDAFLESFDNFSKRK